MPAVFGKFLTPLVLLFLIPLFTEDLVLPEIISLFLKPLELIPRKPFVVLELEIIPVSLPFAPDLL